jgi:hypothetical protein
MHETLSTKFIGNIDNNYTWLARSDKSRVIAGWFVRLVGDNSDDLPNLKLINTNTMRDVGFEIETIIREDVKEFYKPAPEVQDRFVKSGFVITFESEPGNYMLTVMGSGNLFSFYAGVDESVDNVIKLNTDAKTELVVVDNFYSNPDSVRSYALAQEFKTNEQYHKGARTQKSYIPSWVQSEFSRLLNRKVTEFVGATGVFQYCVAKDNVVYHYDTQQYAAMVYLSPNAPLQTGTQTYRSKITGLYGAATDEDVTRLGGTKSELDALSFNGNNFYDKHNLELVDSVANIYNRLVIFNARSLHAATSYYGSNKENARLFHLYFFNVE